MKTPIKPAINFKRTSLIILLLMFVIIGIQSQKSIDYSFYYDTDSFKKALLKIIKFDDQDKIYEYTYYPVINELDSKFLTVIDNMLITLEVVPDINTENQNIMEEEKEDEMEVECWMLNDFNIKPCALERNIDEEVKEEEMEIEGWMLNIDNWEVASN
jgi:hypothetical protein